MPDQLLSQEDIDALLRSAVGAVSEEEAKPRGGAPLGGPTSAAVRSADLDAVRGRGQDAAPASGPRVAHAADAGTAHAAGAGTAHAAGAGTAGVVNQGTVGTSGRPEGAKPRTHSQAITERVRSAVLDTEVELTVHFGSTRLRLADFIALGPGDSLDLDTLAGEALEVRLGTRTVARGTVVVVDDRFALRLTETLAP